MFDERRARRVKLFINNLSHTKGEFHGKPFELLPWQEKIIDDVFGTVRDDDPSKRQYSTAYIEIPKKAGKSELGAAIALNMLCNDDEWKAEVYSCAADRQQASIVYDVAVDMVDQSEALKKRVKLIPSTKRMIYMPTGSIYQVLSSEVSCVTADTELQKSDGTTVLAKDVKAGDVLLSYDGQMPVFDEVVSVEVQKPSPIYEITTYHGRTTHVTAEHPFLRMTQGRRPQDLTHEYEWHTAEELKEKDRIAPALGWYGDENHSGITELEAWALGAWTGDGDCTHFRFINPDKEVIAKFAEYMTSMGSGLKSVYSTRQKQEGKDEYQEPIEHSITGRGKRTKSPGREWIREHFGQKSRARTKEIPLKVMRGNRAAWAAYIAGCIDTDGCVVNGEVRICTTSDRLRKQLQTLYARLGINASMNGYNVTAASYEQLETVNALIAPHMVHVEKKERLAKTIANGRKCIQTAHKSDKIKTIRVLDDMPTYSFEMKRYHTHATDGIITHNTKHGLNVSACIFDELHTQPNRALYDVMTQGSGDARKQPLWVFLTTAGTDRNSICYAVHQKAKDILEGRKVDPYFYPVIFGIDDDDDWHDEKSWYKANPSLGVTIDIDKVRIQYARALETPADENQFRQLRLNEWVKQTTRWMRMDRWDECNGEVDLESLKGRECYAGLDLSSTSDLTAFVLVFPSEDEDDEHFTVVPFFWLPKETLDLRVRRDHVPYDNWAGQGFINTTEGDVVDYETIAAFITKLGEEYNIREIAYDRWNASMFIQRLEYEGFTMIPFGQGFRDMSPPTKELMRLTLEHKISHGAHPVLRWNMDNAAVRIDPAGNQKLDKERSTEKIDGAIAMIMGLDRAMKHNNTSSVYDTRGMIVI